MGSILGRKRCLSSRGVQKQRSRKSPNPIPQINKSTLIIHVTQTFQLLEPFLWQEAGPLNWKLVSFLFSGAGFNKSEDWTCRQKAWAWITALPLIRLWIVITFLSLTFLICNVEIIKQLSHWVTVNGQRENNYNCVWQVCLKSICICTLCS